MSTENQRKKQINQTIFREHLKLGCIALPVYIMINKKEIEYFLENNKQIYNELLNEINNQLSQIIQSSKLQINDKKYKKYSTIYGKMELHKFKFIYSFAKNDMKYGFVV